MIALPEGGRSRPTPVIAYRPGPAAKSAAGSQPTSRQCVERSAVTLVVTTADGCTSRCSRIATEVFTR